MNNVNSFKMIFYLKCAIFWCNYTLL